MEALGRRPCSHRYGSESIRVLITLMAEAIRFSDVARATQLYRVLRDVEGLIHSRDRLPTAMDAVPGMAVHEPQTEFVDGSGRKDVPDSASLTPRETEILSRLSLGRSNKEIAWELDIAEATVKVHVKTLLRKLRVKNRTQAALWALQPKE